MQIVIEIPEELYAKVPTLVNKGSMWIRDILDAVKNGTPLPKGHGKLVDFDRLCKEYWDGDYMEIYKDDLSNIRPIIEADGGGEDGN